MKNEVNVIANSQGLELREGPAPKLVEFKTYNFEGTIACVSEFIRQRIELNEILPNNCVIEYSIDNGFIRLNESFQDNRMSTVVGTLHKHKLLTGLSINNDNTGWDHKKLLKLFKKYAMYFCSPEEHTQLISKLKDFSAKATRTLKDSDDQLGHAITTIETKAETDLPEEISLKIPLFKGHEPVEITLSLFVNVSGSVLQFYLESFDLDQVLEDHKKDIMSKELELIKDFICPKLLIS